MKAMQEADDNGEGLTEDGVFMILSAARRRELLRYLELADGEAELPELTAYLGELEGRDPSVRDDLKPVYVSLVQNHIPVLEEAGVVTYERTRRQIRLTDRADALLVHLHVNDVRPRSTLFSRWFH